MNVLADENVDGPLVAWLRSCGHDVLWLAETAPGREDAEIVELAIAASRVILTQDRDFGELVFRGGKRPPGVIYLRVRSRSVAELLRAFQRAWPQIESHAPGRFIVLSGEKIRIRALLTPGSV